MADIAKVAEELAAETSPAGPPEGVPGDKPEGGKGASAADADANAADAAAEGGTDLVGVLDPEQRINTRIDRSERRVWASAAFVTLVYVLIVAAQVMNLGGLSSIQHELEQQERERRGQGGDTVSVELVPEPDFKAKTEKWQEGANGPPTPAPPQPQQQAALPQPPVEQPPPEQPEQQKPDEKAEKDPEKEPEKEEPEKEVEKESEEKDKGQESGQPSLPDLEAMLDAAATDLQEQVKAHYERKPRRPQAQQQATMSGGGMQVRGVGAGGKSDAFSKSVIDALMKTRPAPVALWGRVLVSFQITQQGDLLYVRVLKSSGNKAMDDAAVNAIHRAKFVKPPPDLPPDARTYIIDYIFG